MRKTFCILAVLIVSIMPQNISNKSLGTVASSLHSGNDKPSVVGANYFMTTGKEYWKNRVDYGLKGEKWKDIRGFESFYQVSSLGRIRSKTRIELDKDGSLFVIPGIIRKQAINRTGYLVVNLQYIGKRKFKPCQVHQLVAIAFKPNPYKKPCVNHKYFITTDNRASKIEWATHKENSAHAYERFKRGESHSYAKLTDKTVAVIYKSKKSARDLSKQFGVSVKTVGRIKTGKVWVHITNKLGKPAKSILPYKINMKIAQKIRKDHREKRLTHRDLGEKYGLKKSAIWGVLNNKRWVV